MAGNAAGYLCCRCPAEFTSPLFPIVSERMSDSKLRATESPTLSATVKPS